MTATDMDGLQVVLEPHRREILRMVWDAETSAGGIAQRFDVSFGAVSQHLAVLRDAGYVTVRKQGRQRFYQADRAALGDLARVLEAMWGAPLDRLVDTIEADTRRRRTAAPPRRPRR
jgi:DNA-binding transcriptional ArsR family regulator